ncbi:uncharacterized protein LOC116142403 [Pistacia vera]|uniref:uncharacterized protein LOC116142403 n=1 Tax=Pistacia vera TaxID=55513 RepID=UPI001263D94D|nr:uncharacterized protein LOC116142403 [Pistacia vera]
MRRSTETVSRNFHLLLNAMLRLHTLPFKNPEAIPENSTDERWKWFKNCLGASDNTYIKAHMPAADIPRYRSRKSEIATNVLGVCTPDMQLIYVLAGGLQEEVNDEGEKDDEGELIRHVEPSAAWTTFRDNLAAEIFNTWMVARNE